MDIKPRPTISEVAEMSGFKELTVAGWFSENKYIQRYNEYHTRVKEEKKQSLAETVRIINESALNMVKVNVNTGNGFIMKHRDVMRGYSNDNKLKLEKLDIQSEEYRIIKEDDIEAGKKPLRIQEALKNALDIDITITDESDSREALEEALERNNKPRFEENIKSVKQKYEEYKDAEY